jgi:hypothetical protein
VINANQSPGMLAAVSAADLALKKLKSQGGPIAIVTAYNTSTSSGQLAFYVERMAKQGVIGIALANSPEFVAAAPGGKPVFGTNPIAFGIPQAHGPPQTFDMATSAIALFGVLTSKAKGQPLPEGVAYGKDGKWTVDAAEALSIGLVNAVRPNETLVADLVARAVLIASKAPLSIRAVKAVVRTGAVLPLAEAMDLELSEYNRLFTTEDRREGVAAFNQKRPAVFRGV